MQSSNSDQSTNRTDGNSSSARRYDVDWLRSIAIGLLILYHIAISFQPFAPFVFFIPNEDPLEWLWEIMEAINIWRIPILFMISGMGVYFAMRRRNWSALLGDRTLRILVPYVFGLFFIGPIFVYFGVAHFFGAEFYEYEPEAAHLWFLANIYLYVWILLPAFLYFKARPENVLFRFLRDVFRRPLGIFIVVIPVIIEITLLDAWEYTTYAETWHGFWLGLVCFFTGFVLVSLGNDFWDAVKRHRFIALMVAFGLYLSRQFGLEPDIWQITTGLESMSWMLAIFGFAAVYLNRPSGTLKYLSGAVYPVYIFHLPVQQALAFYLMPMDLPAELKLIILLVATFGLSFGLYEIARRIKWARPFFGMKWNTRPQRQPVPAPAD